MEEFKLCSDGEFMPARLPCPPPYSGPYYYYPYENIPFPPPPTDTLNDTQYGGVSGGASISAGAVAGVIVLAGIIMAMGCIFVIKFRTRLFRGSTVLRLSSLRHGRDMEIHAAGAAEIASSNSGDVLLDVINGGLEEKLVNLLPVFEYVRFQDDGKELHLNVQQQKSEEGSDCAECAVCLSMFEEKDIVRVLPKCKHVFHLLCIDKWFESHTNCPLCRERITLQTIEIFLENSEDRALDLVDNDADYHQQQLQQVEFDAGQYGSSHFNNHGSAINNGDGISLSLRAGVENGDDQHEHYLVQPPDDHYQNYAISQQETEAVARTNEGLPSALQAVHRHNYIREQSLSVQNGHYHAEETERELPCNDFAVHTECEAARSTPSATCSLC